MFPLSILAGLLLPLALQASEPALKEIAEIHKLNHALIEQDRLAKDADLCQDIRDIQALNPKLYQKVLSSAAIGRGQSTVQNAMTRVTLETVTLSDFCQEARTLSARRSEDAGRTYIEKGNRENLRKVALALHVKLNQLSKLLEQPIQPINSADSMLMKQERTE